MQRDLLIPYALNEVTKEEIPAVDLPERMADLRATLRLDATLEHDTATRKVTRFLCPACKGTVYPRAPLQPGGRHFWSHRKNSDDDCPLGSVDS